MNAWEEIKDLVEGKTIVAAYIVIDTDYSTNKPYRVYFDLRVNPIETMEECLNFWYDSGYGEQELFGMVLFFDGSWLERGEYDGAEWWEYKKTPTVEEVYGSLK